ncbi:MAG: hypothetical protein IJ355_06065 [Prevotella sp.]|nr:hypothetical protein [Prevotella sp.]
MKQRIKSQNEYKENGEEIFPAVFFAIPFFLITFADAYKWRKYSLRWTSVNCPAILQGFFYALIISYRRLPFRK